MGRILRNVVLLALAAVWIMPLYLIVINASKSTEGYRNSERYAPGQGFALFDNICGVERGQVGRSGREHGVLRDRRRGPGGGDLRDGGVCDRVAQGALGVYLVPG